MNYDVAVNDFDGVIYFNINDNNPINDCYDDVDDRVSDNHLDDDDIIASDRNIY